MARRQARLSNRKAQLVCLTAPVEFKVEASAAGEAPKPATFAAVGYSGGIVPGHTTAPRLAHPYVIDLAGTTKARNNYANLDHKSDQRVGHLTKVDNNGARLYIEGTLSAATKYRDEVAQSTRDGMPWEVSIEASLGGQKFIPRGESVRVNGQLFNGPLYVFSKNKFTDVAFVSHGADDGNAVKIAASTAGDKTMNEFQEWLAACGIDEASMSEAQLKSLQSAFEAEQKAKLTAAGGSANDGEPNAVAEAEAKMKAAEQRLAKMAQDFEYKAALAEVVTRTKLERPDQAEVIAKLAAEAEKNHWSTDKLELELIRGMRPSGGVSVHTHSRPEADAKLYEAALALNAGLPNIEKHYDETTLQKVEDAGLRQFSLQQALLTAAASNGYVCRAGQRINAGNLREVLEYAFPSRSARLSGFSGVSMSGPLGAVANKSIVEGYKEEDDTWREIASVTSVGNLQQYRTYRMLDSLEYAEIGATGTIEHGTLDNESYTRQAKTYAKMLGISRTDIINDDLSAFESIRMRLGAGAKKKFNNIFWTAFINNSTFFTSALTNYTSGSTTNLGTDGVGLGLGVLAFRKMLTPTADGTKRVGNGMRPTILLVPPELEANARALYVGRNLVTGANTTMPDANIYANLYRPVVQNRLSDTAFTGYSATAWYLFGSDLKPMAVSFLNGNQTPIVESTDADFNQLGIQFRGYHDFGCDQSEYLAGIKSKGAA